MTALDDALALAGLGWEVFPLAAGTKKPLKGSHGFKDATADEDGVRALFTRRGVRLAVAVALPVDVSAADVDYPDLLAEELPDGPRLTTGRGYHALFRQDDRDLPAKLPGGAGEWRRGGRSYLRVYDPAEWPHRSAALPDLPEWARRQVDEDDWAPPTPDEPITTREDLLAFVGRYAGLEERIILDQFRAMLGDGRIVATDAARPWDVERDLRPIAREFSRKPHPVAPPETITIRYVRSARPVLPELVEGEEQSLQELMAERLPPLRWVVEGLIPEGLGVLGAGPKVGKSLLALQVGIAARTGDEVLGMRTVERPVLLYSLEDGKRVTQERARLLLHGRPVPDHFTIRYSAPRLGSGPGAGLEEEIGEWLVANPGGLVWVDMLAKVRPNVRQSSRSAYDEDYAALGPLHAVAKRIPGSTVMVNTHDRKAGSDDWTQRITGTRGIVGVGDFALFIESDRDGDGGRLHAIGREMRGGSWWVTRAYPRWVIDPHGGLTADQARALAWLDENGPAGPTAFGNAMGWPSSNATRMLGKLIDKGRVAATGDGTYDVLREPSITFQSDSVDSEDNGYRADSVDSDE